MPSMDLQKQVRTTGNPILTSILFQSHAIREKVLAGCFCGTRQKRAHHDGWSAESERLGNVTNGSDSAISNHRYTKSSRVLCDPEDSCSLGPTDCHHLLCDTNWTTSHSHAQCICARVYEVLGLGSGYNISRNDLRSKNNTKITWLPLMNKL